MIVLALLGAGYNQWVFFVAPTLGIDRDLIWAELARLVDKYSLDWELSEHEGLIKAHTGASFRIVGLDKSPQVDKLRGFDTVLFLTDETQNYEHLLWPLLSAVSPALTGRRGTWVSAGTPGPTLAGFWFDITHGEHGFSSHHWTILDNTYNPRPGAEVIAEEIAQLGLSDDHPTVRREFYGEWAEDANYTVCDFQLARNVSPTLPDGYGPYWKKVIGMDFGFNDATSWVVLAIDLYSRRTCVVENVEVVRWNVDQIAEETRSQILKHGTTHVVVDPGGGGKSFYETFNARYASQIGCTLRSAHKVDKAGSITLLNTELRTGRLQVLPDCPLLISQLQTLRWKTQERTEILSGTNYPDHSFDALRYALMEASPWAVKHQTPLLNSQEKERLEARIKEVKRQQRGDLFERHGW